MYTTKHIGYLGPEGTFSEQAAMEVFGDCDSFSYHRYPTIQECLLAANKQLLDYALVPVENSIGGSVNITVSQLVHDLHIPIQGEVHLPISYELLGSDPEVCIDSCEIIYGHPQALRQCDDYLRRHYNDVVLQPTDSSSAAAKMVAENPDQAALALANTATRHIYGLTVIASEIENNAENTTRFIVLGDDAIDLSRDIIKSTLVITLPGHDLRVLQNVLGTFETLALKPLKIESVPLKKKLGEYAYIIDVDTTSHHDSYLQACDAIQKWGCSLRHLGTYGVCHHRGCDE